MNDRQTQLAAFDRLLTILDELRVECPWDRKQTHASLRNLTIEETYELADAILQSDQKGIREEVGDLLLHMAFYAKIGSESPREAGGWDIADALNGISEKLISRHPHIYGDVKVADEAEVKRNWEQLKLKEGKKSLLEGVPIGLPAMVKAFRMQEKTKQVGFEWETPAQCWAKVEEEIAELQQAVSERFGPEKVEEEFGDVLFSLVNYARFIQVDPETALERVNRKFKTRFEFIEKNAPRSLADMTLEEMDALWNAAKKA